MRKTLLLIIYIFSACSVLSREPLVVEFVFDAQVSSQEITDLLSWKSLDTKNISIELTRLKSLEKYKIENEYNHLPVFEAQNPCGFVWCIELKEYLQKSEPHKAFVYNPTTKPLEKCGVLDRIAILAAESTLSKELKIAKKNKLKRVIIIIHKPSNFIEVPQISLGSQFTSEFQEFSIFQGQKISLEPKLIDGDDLGEGRFYWFKQNSELSNSREGKISLTSDESSVFYCEWRSDDESCISRRSEVRINVENCDDEIPFKIRFRNSELFQREVLDAPINGYDEAWWLYPSPKSNFYYFIADSVCGAYAFKLEIRNLKGEELFSFRYDMQNSSHYSMVYNDEYYDQVFEEKLIFGVNFHDFKDKSGEAFNEDLELRIYPIYRGRFENTSNEKYLIRFNRCLYED